MKHFYLSQQFHISYISFPAGLTAYCKLTGVNDSKTPSAVINLDGGLYSAFTYAI